MESNDENDDRKNLKILPERHRQLRLLAAHDGTTLHEAFERHCGAALDAAERTAFGVAVPQGAKS